MKTTTTPKSRNPQIHSEAFNEREIWYKLVVKIILWKEKVTDERVANFTDKITLADWKLYSRRILKINETGEKNKISAMLKETWQKIKDNNGFIE